LADNLLQQYYATPFLQVAELNTVLDAWSQPGTAIPVQDTQQIQFFNYQSAPAEYRTYTMGNSTATYNWGWEQPKEDPPLPTLPLTELPDDPF
jgi:hypothetical protein